MTAVSSIVFDKHRYQNKELFRKFIEMNTKEVELDFEAGEYSSARTAYASLRQASKRYSFPVYIAMVDGRIHLVRQDM